MGEPYLTDAGWTLEIVEGHGHFYRDPETGRRFRMETAISVQTRRDIIVAPAAAALADEERAVWSRTAAATNSPRAADEMVAEFRARFVCPETAKDWSGWWMDRLVAAAKRNLCPVPPGCRLEDGRLVDDPVAIAQPR